MYDIVFILHIYIWIHIYRKIVDALLNWKYATRHYRIILTLSCLLNKIKQNPPFRIWKQFSKILPKNEYLKWRLIRNRRLLMKTAVVLGFIIPTISNKHKNDDAQNTTFFSSLKKTLRVELSPSSGVQRYLSPVMTCSLHLFNSGCSNFMLQ